MKMENRFGGDKVFYTIQVNSSHASECIGKSDVFLNVKNKHMKWLDNSFWGSYYPLIIIVILIYPVYKVLRDEEYSLKTKISYLVLILFIPLIGSVVYLFIEIGRRFR